MIILPAKNDFFHAVDKVWFEEIDIPEEEAEKQKAYWDRYHKDLMALPEDRKLRLQKDNTLDYLKKYQLTLIQLKSVMKVLGFYGGQVDNDEFDVDLVRAIEAFQRKYQLRHIDGMFGQLTYLKLEEVYSRKRR